MSIDQELIISQQFSLLGQRGSGVIRGNPMVIPIENSFLYLEPVYLIAKEPITVCVLVPTSPDIRYGLAVCPVTLRKVFSLPATREDAEGSRGHYDRGIPLNYK